MIIKVINVDLRLVSFSTNIPCKLINKNNLSFQHYTINTKTSYNYMYYSFTSFSNI